MSRSRYYPGKRNFEPDYTESCVERKILPMPELPEVEDEVISAPDGDYTTRLAWQHMVCWPQFHPVRHESKRKRKKLTPYRHGLKSEKHRLQGFYWITSLCKKESGEMYYYSRWVTKEEFCTRNWITTVYKK